MTWLPPLPPLLQPVLKPGETRRGMARLGGNNAEEKGKGRRSQCCGKNLVGVSRISRLGVWQRCLGGVDCLLYLHSASLHVAAVDVLVFKRRVVHHPCPFQLRLREDVGPHLR